MPDLRTDHRAAMLLERTEQLVSSNPIPYGQVKQVTTIAHHDGAITLHVTYDDGSFTDRYFAPKTPAHDMTLEARLMIDKGCAEIRKARNLLADIHALNTDDGADL